MADLTWSVLAFLSVEAQRQVIIWDPRNRSAPEALLPFLAGALILWFLLSSWMQLHRFRGGWRFPAIVSEVFLGVLCLMCLLLSVAYLSRQQVSRLALAYFGTLLFLGFVGIRYVAYLLLFSRSRVLKLRHAVIVGSDRIAREIALKIRRHPEMFCEVAGFLNPEETPSSSANSEAFSAGTIGIIELLHAQGVTDLIVATPSSPEILNLVGRCRADGICASFVPQPYELYLSKPSLIDLDGIPILELGESTPSLFLAWKRVVDIGLGTVLSLVAAPVLLLVAVGLRLTRDRAFRWEQRCGKNGRIFSMLRLNVDRNCVAGTWFERMLVNMSATELPQLWNVLRNEMSLVGPRPDPPERVKRYSEWEQQRLSLKPGMTGLAQVHGLRDQNSLEEKTRFDLQYMLSLSFMADASILLQTLWTLAARLFPYPRLALGSKRPKTASSLTFSEATSPLLEETLQSAQRSHSSAD